MNQGDDSHTPSDDAVSTRTDVYRPAPDGGKDEMVEIRHRIHRTIRQALERHPAVLEARGIPEGRYTEVEATVDPLYFGRNAADATIRVSWQPDSTEHRHPADDGGNRRRGIEKPAHFVIQYSDTEGYDCGFHCEPNPHVEGLLHVQERATADDAYTYEPLTLDASAPIGVLWEVLAALETRLRGA